MSIFLHFFPKGIRLEIKYFYKKYLLKASLTARGDVEIHKRIDYCS